MSLCVPQWMWEGDRGDKRGTCPSVSPPEGGRTGTSSLGLVLVPLGDPGWQIALRKGKEAAPVLGAVRAAVARGFNRSSAVNAHHVREERRARP